MFPKPISWLGIEKLNLTQQKLIHLSKEMYYSTKQTQQVARLSQRDRTTHKLLRFAKLRSGIFEPPFWGGLGEM